MNTQKCSRFILGLRATGWDDTKINDFVLYIETGDSNYMPKNAPNAKEVCEE